ncbi:hypothetical protein CDAR_396681 [Caerostris darwini]|uniref:Uncharacterized protein n=1 Tax=Caerostris darwini TaxID=1538125 RepID=A0AAV4PMJ0_9ARAC|nr:hypothetical protein CDAR_396681 [Caerostris darwini]
MDLSKWSQMFPQSCSINVVCCPSKAPQRPMKVPIYWESLDRNIVLKPPQGVPEEIPTKTCPGVAQFSGLKKLDSNRLSLIDLAKWSQMPPSVVQLTSSAASKAPQRPMKVPIYWESLDRNIALKSPQGVLGELPTKT